MTLPGLRGVDGQPAAPPYSNGPYTWSESIDFAQGVSNLNITGTKFYVSRNIGVSGDGLSWGTAFLTVAEGIAALNTAYAAQRNVYALFIDEGWYIEVPSSNHILTASDCYIIGTAPGSHDPTVLYGSSVAGTATVTSGAPILTLAGSNCTIINMGFFTWDPLYASVRDGSHSGDPDSPGSLSTFNNRFINCNFIRDQADGSLGGLDCVSNEGPVVTGCTFSTSCKDFGVRIRSNGSTNPVNVIIEDCRFTGTPIGVDANAGHNAIVRGCVFMDDTTDRPDTIDLPVDCNGSVNTAVYNCYSEFSNADISDNGTSPLAINNFFLATPA